MAKTGQTITDFIDNLPPHYATPELRIDCPEDAKFVVIEKIANYVTLKNASADIMLIDGVRVRDDEGWWLVRASNTEAALVARAEGKTPVILAKLVKDIEVALATAGLKWSSLKWSQNKTQRNNHDNK